MPMVWQCKKAGGISFEEAKLVSTTEATEQGLDRIKFAREIDIDVTNDGLKDHFRVEAGSLGKVADVHLRMYDGATPRIATKIKSFSFFANNMNRDAILARAGIASRDVDGDGKADLILRLPEGAGGEASYRVLINSGSGEDEGPVTVPSIHSVSVADGERIKSRSMDGYCSGEELNEPNAITEITMHPGSAQFVRLGGGPIVPITPGQPVILGSTTKTHHFPVSFDNQLSVEFLDTQQRVIQSYPVTHNLENVITEDHHVDGRRFMVYHNRDTSTSRSRPRIALERPLFDCVGTALVGLEGLWGEVNVRDSSRQIVFVDDLGYKNGTIGRPFHSDLVFLSVFYPHPREAARVIRHETAHNLEILMGGSSEKPLLATVYQRLHDKKSMLFDFINESFFFDAKGSGHSQRDANELFASLTNALAEGPDQLARTLSRFKTVHPGSDALTGLIEDLRDLLGEYRAVMERQGQADAQARLKPFDDVLTTVTTPSPLNKTLALRGV
ncbi:MAG: hypothetical protein HQM16_08870 [Deltaproteobacteria bacterium]|nr:hypothetical protein [Deltaproteobacteria bacterium]